MTFHSIHVILKNLSGFFDPEVTLDDIDDAFDNSDEAGEKEDDPGGGSDNDLDTVESLKLLAKIKYDSKCTDVLNELISAAVQNRETPGIFFCTNDSWEFLAKHIKVKEYLTFVYCLVRLVKHNCLDKINRKLSVLAARCYMVLLTTPGAKPAKVFNENVCMRAMEPFEVIEKMRQNKASNKIKDEEFNEYLMDVYNYLLELKIVFGHVSLDEHENVLKSVLSTMTIIVRNHYYSGYDSIYAYYMTIEAYNVLELIGTSNREKSEHILSILMSATCCLHLFTTQPKIAPNVSIDSATVFDSSITQFFLSLLNKQPNNVMIILQNFIKVVITKRDGNLNEENYGKFLDACVIYECAMYNAYNKSCVPFLEEAMMSTDSHIRQNSIELLYRILLADSEDSSLTRELRILKIILKSIIDIDTNVKVSSLVGILNVIRKGNSNCLKIFEIAFNKTGDGQEQDDSCLSETDFPSSAAEISALHNSGSDQNYDTSLDSILQIFPIKKYTKSSENISSIQNEISKLLLNLLHLLNNTFYSVRQSVIEILEYLLSKNLNLVENSQFYNYYTTLSTDPSPKVRRQQVLAIDRLIENHPTHEAIVKIYTECIIDFLKDRDKQIFNLAIDSINKRIFSCLNTYELSQSAKHKRPWFFFRMIFALDLRNAFYEIMDSLIKQNVVTQKTLSIVETHLSTGNATEAWTITYFLSKKIKSKNPEYIIAAFKDVIINPEIVLSESYDFIFQVMNTWVENFERSTLQKLQEMIRDIIHSCSSEAHMMSNLYNFANKAHSLCNDTMDFNWINEIYEEATIYLINNKIEFLGPEKLDSKFAQKLYIFSESSSDLLQRPDAEVVDLLTTTLRRVESKEIDFKNPYYEEKICIVIIVITRLLIRDSMLALSTVQHFNAVASIAFDSYNISSNLAHAFRDLFVKFGILMECTLKSLARQMLSRHPKIRLQALTFLAEIIMKDLTKINEYLLFHIFLAVTDSDKKISNLGKNLILSYVEHRNNSMLRDCFMDNIMIIYRYIDFTQFTFVGPGEIRRTNDCYRWPDDNERTYDLYNFILEAIDPIEGYKLFEWIKILNIEMNHKDFNSQEAKYVIRDSIYILRKLCFNLTIQEETKTSSSKRGIKNDENDGTDDENEEERKLLLDANPKETCEPFISTIPKFYDTIKLKYPEFQHKLDRLIEGLCICFQDMIAVPSAFWDPHLDRLHAKTKQSKDYPCSVKSNEKLRLINYLSQKDRDPLEAYFYR